MKAVILLQETLADYPAWLLYISFAIGIIGPFWGHIKSTIEIKILGRQKEIERDEARRDKEIERLLQRVEKLEKKNAYLDEKNKRTEKANLAFSMAFTLFLKKYEQGNPGDTMTITYIKKLIKENVTYEEEEEEKPENENG